MRQVGSVHQDVFVVGHGIHVVKRLAGPRPVSDSRWRASRCQRWDSRPQAQVSQDFLHDYTLVNHGNDAHEVLADWATERIGVPDRHNDVAPFLRGQAARRWRDYIGPQGLGGGVYRRTRLAAAAHLVAVSAIVTHHLNPLVRNMLGDGGQEIGGTENLEISVYFDAHPRAVDDIVREGLDRHFFDREGIAQNILGQIGQLGLGLGFNANSGMDVETAMDPRAQRTRPFRRKQG